jgi:uncharacterized protein (DUF1684 family)
MMRMRLFLSSIVCCATLLVVACGPQPRPGALPAADYLAQVARWDEERAAALTAHCGWLSLAGLFWLDAGEQTLGSAAGSDILLPAGAPPLLGTLALGAEGARLVTAPGVTATCGGKAVADMLLRSDQDPSGGPDRVEVGGLTFAVIVRGGKPALRLWDDAAPARAAFTGIARFPVDAGWRIEGKLEPYAKPKKVTMSTVIGTEEEGIVPGVVRFRIGGKEAALEPLAEEGSDELFLVFSDPTNGKETYGGGRFLDAAPPTKKGVVVLDFNKAYNPPCAFTPWATCPVPRPENRLPLPVTAGEKKYGAH